MTEGGRLRAYIEGAMSDRGIESVSELARRAHVSRDTFQAWWRGRPPQRSTAELVARELGVTYGDLIAAREGTLMGSPVNGDTYAGLPALIEAQTDALKEQTAAFLVLAQSIDRAAESVTGEVGTWGSTLADVLGTLRSLATGATAPVADDAPTTSNHPGR